MGLDYVGTHLQSNTRLRESIMFQPNKGRVLIVKQVKYRSIFINRQNCDIAFISKGFYFKYVCPQMAPNEFYTEKKQNSWEKTKYIIL